MVYFYGKIYEDVIIDIYILLKFLECKVLRLNMQNKKTEVVLLLTKEGLYKNYAKRKIIIFLLSKDTK